jgi:hypothetical protein
MHFRCWLHCSAVTLANVYSGYICVCAYWFDKLGCNSTIYVFIKMLNIKICIMLSSKVLLLLKFWSLRRHIFIILGYFGVLYMQIWFFTDCLCTYYAVVPAVVLILAYFPKVGL